ncbi:MAG: cytochrome c [Betaproteobacteria bacterium]|nr:cytochrome c [Betaproteobacteria bacterium]
MADSHSKKTFLIVALATSLASLPVLAQDPTDEVAAKIDEKYGGSIKKLFATKCSWCHQGYGMKQADGPKLAGISKTLEQVMKLIREGKSPMPGFKSQLKDEEVQALAEYIKALPAN